MKHSKTVLRRNVSYHIFRFENTLSCTSTWIVPGETRTKISLASATESGVQWISTAVMILALF